MFLWTLYPQHKRPQIINVDQEFGHFMILKFGFIDPNKVVGMQVDLALFNQVLSRLIFKIRKLCMEIF